MTKTLLVLAAALLLAGSASGQGGSRVHHEDHQPVVPADPGHRLPLRGGQGRQALARGDDGHPPDDRRRRREVRGRRRPPVAQRPPRGEDERLVRPGREGQRLVLRRGHRRARRERQGDEPRGLVADGREGRARRDLHAGAPARRPDRAARSTARATPRTTSSVLAYLGKNALLIEETDAARAGRGRPQALRPRHRHGPGADGEGRRRAERARLVRAELGRFLEPERLACSLAGALGRPQRHLAQQPGERERGDADGRADEEHRLQRERRPRDVRVVERRRADGGPSPGSRSAAAARCVGRCATSRFAKIAPKSAIPIEPPTCRKSIESGGRDAHELRCRPRSGRRGRAPASPSRSRARRRACTGTPPASSSPRRAARAAQPDRHHRRADDRERLVPARSARSAGRCRSR